MKAEELQIGDWVEYFGEYTKIKELSSVLVLLKGKNKSEYITELEDIKPILITSEILKKNGFKKSNDPYDSTLTLWLNKTFYVEYLIDNNAIFIFTENYSYDAYCYYIHELQQALRLCKINKKIKLCE